MTEKQYTFAWTIAEALGLQLPKSWSNQAFSNFIQDNLTDFQEWQKEEYNKQILRNKVREEEYQINYELAALEDAMRSKTLYEQGYDI